MGAFGAHAMRDLLSHSMLQAFRTGVDYHLWHALGLIGLGLYNQNRRSSLVDSAGWLMLAGLVLFSGSLYLMAILDLRWLGMITPFGGTALMVAWALFGLAVYKNR